MKAKINKPEDVEYIDIVLTEEKFPIAYRNKLEELIENGCTEEDARDFLKTMTFQMELIYHKNNGLFLVESDACETGMICSPYDGTWCEDCE